MRNIRWTVLVLGFLILFTGMNCGHASENEEASEVGLSKEEKKLIEAGLKPFEPKLLWEKRFKGQISHLDLAKESGDVIVSTVSPCEVYLFDRNGSLLWNQGTIEEIHDPWNGHISDDGEEITYDVVDWETYFTVVFYVDRNNKEKWHKAVPGASYLSPDGSWVVVAPYGGTGSKIVIVNDRGEIVSKHNSWSRGIPVTFSENSKHVGIVDDIKEICRVFDRQGKLVLELKAENGRGIRSFSSNGLLSIRKWPPEKIYNIRGDTTIRGDSMNLSGDGRVIAKVTWNNNVTKIEMVEVPSLKIAKSYQLTVFDSPYPLNLSFSGSYLVLGPYEHSRDVIVLDTEKGRYWKTQLVIPPEDVVRELSPNFQWSQGVFFTKDEKYMVTHVIDEKAVHTIKYYKMP